MSTRRIDAYSLKLFMAVAQTGSIKQAARNENIATSALSRRISDLEQALSAELFHRSPQGLVLSEQGHVALKHASSIDAAMEELLVALHPRQDQDAPLRGTIRLITNPSAQVSFLPEVLRVFRLQQPQVNFDLREAVTSEVIAACLEGQADLGVGIGRAPLTSLRTHQLATDSLVVLMPTGHPLESRAGPVALADVLQHPLVSLRAGGALDQLLRTHAMLQGCVFKPGLVVASFEVACRMVKAGLGVAIVPGIAAMGHVTDRYSVRPLAESWARRELVAYEPRSASPATGVREFLAVLRAGLRSVGDSDWSFQPAEMPDMPTLSCQ